MSFFSHPWWLDEHRCPVRVFETVTGNNMRGQISSFFSIYDYKIVRFDIIRNIPIVFCSTDYSLC